MSWTNSCFPLSLACPLLLSLHTSFTAHSLAFCGESVSLCVCERSLLQSFLKGQTMDSVNQCRHKEDNYGRAGTKGNQARCSHVLLKALCQGKQPPWPPTGCCTRDLLWCHAKVSQRPVLAVRQEYSCRPTSPNSLCGLMVVILIRRLRGRDLNV